MDFEYSPRVEQLRQRVREFMEDRILPTVPEWERDVAAGNPHPQRVSAFLVRCYAFWRKGQLPTTMNYTNEHIKLILSIHSLFIPTQRRGNHANFCTTVTPPYYYYYLTN